MQIKQTNIDSNTIKFEIVVSKEKMEPNLQKSYIKNVKNIFIPGFRKGKVPRNVVERYYGKNILFNDAFNFLLPDLFSKVVEENKLEPIAQPEYNVQKINDDGSVEVEIVIYNKPNFEINNYRDYDFKLKEAVATEEEVNKLINEELEKAVVMVPSQNPTKNGDLVNFNFEGFLNGIPFEGGKAENHELVLGEKKFINGFEDNLLNHDVDDEFEFNITFPSEYHVPDLAGKETTFKIKINSVKEKQLPELNDDFINSISLYSTVEDYTENLKNKIIEENKIKNKKELQNEILNKIVEDTIIEVPELMVKNHIDKTVNQLSMNLQNNNYTLQQYLEYNNIDMEELRKQMEPRAIVNIKMNLIIEKMAKLENIEISQEEFSEKVNEVINQYKFEENQINQNLITEIRGNMMYEKVVDFLSSIYIDKR